MKASSTQLSTLLASGLTALLGVMPPGALAAQERFPRPPPEWPEPVNDDVVMPFLLVDRLEYQWNDEGADARVWDAEGWIGSDWNRFWFKTEGERAVGGETEEAQFETLYARLVTPFWYLQAGIRYDARPEPERSYGALGIQGLAPYWFEVDATAYLSDKGDVSASFEAEYDLTLTQRLILQPRFEIHLSAAEVEELGLGKGFNDVSVGLRLRYEIKREFAPYIGASWMRRLGDTADFAEAQGAEAKNTTIIAGVRLWF